MDKNLEFIDLIRKSQSGNCVAQNELYNVIKNVAVKLFNETYRQNVSYEDMEDIVQTKMPILFQYRFDDGGNPLGFIYKTFKNAFNSHVDKMKKKRTKVISHLETPNEDDCNFHSSENYHKSSESESPDGSLLRREIKDLLDRALRGLGEKQKNVIKLGVLEGLSPHEIMEMTGCNRNQVDVNKHLGLKQIQVHIKASGYY